jgi:DNA repair exonuclease SbcCD ATPase subunit
MSNSNQQGAKAMKIVSLETENVKRLKAVRIEPDGTMVVIGGKNAQGKSSVLDSIEMALGGKDSVPKEPIRRGEKTARVVLQLDGEHGLKIVRKFTEKGSTLSIETADGMKPKSPQALLDSLCNRIAFDPLQFIRQRPADQAATLRKLVGIDFAELDRKRKELYDSRTNVNRDAKRERAAADSVEVVNAPKELVDVAGLMEQLNKAQEVNRTIDDRGRKLTAAENKLQGLKDEQAEIEEQIRQLLEQSAAIAKRIEEGEAWCKQEVTAMADLNPVEVLPIEEQIRNAETLNAAYRKRETKQAHTKQADMFERQSEKLTKQIEAIDDEKADTLAAAKWPVDGLGFGDEGVTFQGLPIEQASSAEQTRVSMAIGLALNPELPLVLIRDGSLLDEDSMSEVAKQAAAAGAQVWLERVGKGAECSVIIEDGEVLA